MSFNLEQAREALAVLGAAPSHGLRPQDYGLDALTHAVAQGHVGPTLDAALTTALTRYLQELHAGRVNPAQVQHRFASAHTDVFDARETLRAALALQDLGLAVQQAVPRLRQYEQLRVALAQYRALLTHPAWQGGLPALPGASVRAGQTWAGLALTAERLHALGDLPQAPTPFERLEEPLIAAVAAFQQRHGLQADGVIGRTTWAALQTPLAQRVRQLELALERLRWTPILHAPRMVVINLPEFVLRAYAVQGERIAVQHEMRVIVGQALDMKTPLIHEPMRRIEFNPYWNVPASIARKELVPRLRREPGHWQEAGYEFVGADGLVDPEWHSAKLRAVLDGDLRIRQRPGPRNPLGRIKFEFPNRDAIYLHDTPSSQLFDRARRDFSHGCIRVQDPVALAVFALQGQDGWNELRVREAMTSGVHRSVALVQPLSVLLAYGTALVKQSRVYFFNDLYGHDRTLDAALRASGGG